MTLSTTHFLRYKIVLLSCIFILLFALTACGDKADSPQIHQNKTVDISLQACYDVLDSVGIISPDDYQGPRLDSYKSYKDMKKNNVFGWLGDVYHDNDGWDIENCKTATDFDFSFFVFPMGSNKLKRVGGELSCLEFTSAPSAEHFYQSEIVLDNLPKELLWVEDYYKTSVKYGNGCEAFIAISEGAVTEDYGKDTYSFFGDYEQFIVCSKNMVVYYGGFEKIGNAILKEFGIE